MDKEKDKKNESTEKSGKNSRQKPFKIIGNECCPQEKKIQVDRPDLKQRFVTGSVDTSADKIPRVTASLKWIDHWGTFKARWSVGRMRYTIDPGLYALGSPADQAPVLVTGNYKMSFDRLREVLPEQDAWILVLDTKGINVWCAAGKGTFGTDELVARIKASGLDRIVKHRQLILPQLAGPGIAAYQVKKRSGFKVIYGPIRAKDLPAFMDNGLSASPEMRKKTFPLGERIVLVPVELVASLKAAVFVLPVIFLLSGFGGTADFWANALNDGLFALIAILAAILTGTVLTPVLLPWLPGKAFSTKGFCLGFIAAMVSIFYRSSQLRTLSNPFELAAWFFIIPAIVAYLAMNFTGASTYTSLSGVKKEMRWAVPLEIGAGGIGLGLWIGSRFII